MRYVGLLNKEVAGGSLMILIGLASVFGGIRYGLGTFRHMGAGFFPVAVGSALALVGGSIACTGAAREAARRHVNKKPDLRGWVFIIGGILGFMLLGAYGGLVPATFAVVFISALGDRGNSVKEACLLALAMVAVSVGVFWWGLELPMPLLRIP